MASEAMKNVVAIIEANAQSRPSAAEFEMAYQVRVAMDRIRFAIRLTEMSSQQSEEKAEAATQLADALDRLDSAERRFQDRWRKSVRFNALPPAEHFADRSEANGHIS
jgi:hypothetical protein